MPTKIARKYKVKDVEMLIATATIIENAIANRTFLETKRSTWASPFFDDLKTKIKTTTETYLGKDAAQQMRQSTQIVLEIQKQALTYLGKDAAQQMRQSTQVVLGIQKQALTDLAEFKVQVEQDFKSNPIQKTEILTQLGITAFYKMAQKGDQEGLVNLLFQFKTNLNPTLSAEIVAKGTSQSTIDNIVNYAEVLKNANIDQETFKGTRKEITDEAIKAFNEIYESVISVAKIANNFYKTDKIKQQQFSFAKVTATLNSQSVK